MELDLSTLAWAAIGLTIFVAGLSQGAMGFGFPAVSTPVLALMTDIKTAVLLNLLPNMTVNIISVIQGGRWRASLGVHWPVAAYALIGSFIGASVLIVAPQEPLRLLLAAIIFVYLYQKQIEIQFIKKIRDEMKFSGIEELKNQLMRDKEASLRLLN